MDCYGALSIDFLLSILMVMVVMGSLSTIVSNGLDMAEQSDELVNARMLAEYVAGAIDQTYSGGNGHGIRIVTPPEIGGKYYKVTVNSSGVFIKIGGKDGQAHLVPQKISGTISLISSDVTLLPGRTYFILNIKDEDGYSWIVIKPE
jgi:hypothetical protein